MAIKHELVSASQILYIGHILEMLHALSNNTVSYIWIDRYRY